jgi:hypothetical protein
VNAPTFDPEGPVVVFAGPSLPPAVRPSDARLLWRPPAAAGDAYALAAEALAGVVLIDGLFDEVPAIRHKELLSVISPGVPVYGAASMGALRAAELHSLGMIGVGRIFAAFRSRRLDADDEVALVHGPASFDWAPLTEPLVNVRATLLRAVRNVVVDCQAARAVLNEAKATFYKHRTWPALLSSDAVARSFGADSIERFKAWLPAGYVDLKRMDAFACLEVALRGRSRAGALRPPPPDTVFSGVLADQVYDGLRPEAGCF